MMLDIFSSFDPFIYYSTFIPAPMFWAISMFLLMLPIQYFWLNAQPYPSISLSMKELMISQTSRTKGSKLLGFMSFIPHLFLAIIMLNFIGLMPYIFSTSSHLAITLSLGVPLWLALIMSSFSYNTWDSTAHLLPSGAPDWLNPFLVLVETLSTLVRPITLSFRLAANMTAGHVVLGLMGSYLVSSMLSDLFSTSSLMTMLIATGYIIFEMGICLIQSYIFCLLLTLYSDDHA